MGQTIQLCIGSEGESDEDEGGDEGDNVLHMSDDCGLVRVRRNSYSVISASFLPSLLRPDLAVWPSFCAVSDSRMDFTPRADPKRMMSD